MALELKYQASAALSAALVGFGGSVAIVLEAAKSVGATPEQAASWVMVLCLGVAIASPLLSWRLRMPVITAWSTPGAALIAVSASGVGLSNAVGAFMIAASLMVVTALIRPLGDLVTRIPRTVAAAMLAGILLPFCLRMVLAIEDIPWMIQSLIVAFFIIQVRFANMAVPIVLVLGIILAFVDNRVGEDCCSLTITVPTWIAPEFSWQQAVGLALPFYIVTMASQNLAGLAVMKADNYEAPAPTLIGFTGFLSLLAAPFGGHSICLSSITASICTGPNCHPDSTERWKSGLYYGGFYVVIALLTESFVTLLFALPAALITTFVGLALLGPLSGSIKVALSGDNRESQAAILTFVVAASGVTLFEINAAPWSLLAGLLLIGIYQLTEKR